MKISKEEQIDEFLSESNAIEREYSEIALEDAKKAWEYAYNNRKNITVDYILKIHKILLRSIDPDIAGKVRNCAVMIGYEVKKAKPEEVLLLELRDWVQKSEIRKKEKGELTEKDIKQLHVEYEGIHIFFDGNGRTGRILWQIQRLNNGLPIKIIYEAEKSKYYEWF